MPGRHQKYPRFAGIAGISLLLALVLICSVQRPPSAPGNFQRRGTTRLLRLRAREFPQHGSSMAHHVVPISVASADPTGLHVERRPPEPSYPPCSRVCRIHPFDPEASQEQSFASWRHTGLCNSYGEERERESAQNRQRYGRATLVPVSVEHRGLSNKGLQ